MVFYRKYRPQTINELDSAHVRETLSSVLTAKEIPHAFLFTGPKGLGKTSTARIVAKVVNCENSSQFTVHGSQIPCNTCESCISITNGTNIDVLEIDGASNRGIDEIRDLREKARLAPSTSKKKVYIIDEVHMLTTEAFNALLKTIEEPPSHVMFLFCTTEPHKVPETILSRCFHIAFHRATDEEIVHSLKRIVAAEKIEVDADALLAIAQLADGGFRDAAKILEEVSLLAKEQKITKELVEKELRVTGYGLRVEEMLVYLQEKNMKASLTAIAQSVEQGIDMKYLSQRILEALHEMLLKQSGVVQHLKFEIGNLPAGRQGLKLEMNEIVELVSLFSKAYLDMKFAVIPQLPLEIAVIRWCTQGQQDGAAPSVDEATQGTQDGGLRDDGKPTITSLTRKQQELKVQSILNPVKEAPKKVTEPDHEQRVLPPKDDTQGSVLENIIYKIKPINHSIAAVLRSCRILAYTDTEIVIEAGYKFHKERLDEAKTRELLEKALKEITGKVLAIKVELKK